MILISIEAMVTVCLIVLYGLILNRAFARWSYRNSSFATPQDDELIILGILPGLALIGILTTTLGFFHLLKLSVLIPVMLISTLFLRSDLWEILRSFRASVISIGLEFKNQNFMPLISAITLIALLLSLIIMGQVPSENADVWVFQLPLAQSIVRNSGFIYPQIDHNFYGNMPLFFNLMFALPMMVVNHYISADSINIAIYFGFLLLLLSFSKNNRSLCFIVIYCLIVSSNFFTPGVPVPMSDISRSCFTVASFLFFYRYLISLQRYDLLCCSLLAGSSVAGKYTELVAPLLLGTCLIGLVIKQKTSFTDLLFAALFFVLSSAFWYLKNLITLGNPIYPFVWGHPGLSDTWMAEYQLELSRAFDPANRIYNTNLLTFQGLKDFAFILHSWFFENMISAKIAVVILLLGLFQSNRKILIIYGFAAILFIIWYSFMFNHIRWATSAYLLFLSTAVIVFSSTNINNSIKSYFNSMLRSKYSKKLSIIKRYFIWIKPSAVPTFIFFLTIGIYLNGLKPLNFYKIISSLGFPQQFVQVVSAGGVDEMLAGTREGYNLYRYIIDNDLHKVFQPFDSGSINNSISYNGGIDGNWFIPSYVLPKSIDGISNFVKENNIKYFVKLNEITELRRERIGNERALISESIIDFLIPASTVVYKDSFGWTLYKVLQ